MLLQFLKIKIRRIPIPDHLPPVHKIKMIRYWPGEVDLLLHQQYRDTFLSYQPADNIPDLNGDRRLDTFCRLIQQQQRRTAYQGTANSQLLLLTAAKIAARAPPKGFEDREQLINSLLATPI